MTEIQLPSQSKSSLSEKVKKSVANSIASLKSVVSTNTRVAPIEADVLYGLRIREPRSQHISSIPTVSEFQDDIQDISATNYAGWCCWRFKRILRRMWATRDMEDFSKNKELLLKTAMRELFMYTIFLVLLMIIAFGMLSTNIFYVTSVVQSIYSTQEFNNVRSPEKFWTYAYDSLAKNLFWEDYWYNQRPNTSNDFIFFESKLLGLPQIRQLKTKTNSCISTTAAAALIPYCYDFFYSDNVNKTTFGPNNNSAWQYTESEDSSVESGYSGVFGYYPKGGYIQTLPRNLSASTDIINELKSNLWIDHGTRVVFIDFTLYNANINLFCVIKMVFEFPPTGGVFPKINIRTVKLIRYLTPLDYFVMACEIIYLFFIAYYIVEEILEIKVNKLKYFTDVWNFLDIFVIILSVVCAIFNIYRTVYVDIRLDQVLNNQNSYVDFDFISYWQKIFRESIAVTIFLAVVKIFKYISFNKSMNQLTDTLGNSLKDLISFSILFFIFFFAFAQTGYLLFGNIVEDFREFDIAVFTLFRIILGEFNFPALVQAHSFLGPLYFITYVFLVFFILINMFVVIINDSYIIVKKNIANYKQEFHLSTYLQNKILKKMKKDKIIKIHEVLQKAEMVDKDKLSFSDWRNELQNHGYADVEIQSLFMKYDLDRDLILDYEERMNMLEDIKNGKVTTEDEPNHLMEPGDCSVSAQLPEDLEKEEIITVGQVDELIKRIDCVQSGLITIVSKIDLILVRLSTIEEEKLSCQRSIGYSLEILFDSKTSLRN